MTVESRSMLRSPIAMRVPVSNLVVSLGVLLMVSTLPAQAQSDRQVAALVEALRQAAPQTGSADDGLYSDWQVMSANIPRWSKSCVGRELSPTEFEASPDVARSVVTCIMRDVLEDEYAASGNDEMLAVRRSAAWWMRGDPSQYNNSDIADYVQKVVDAYAQQGASTAADAPQPAPPAQQPPQSSEFDRYMAAGYEATQQRDYETALLYFQRALDERPNNTYAQQAIQNVEQYRTGNSEDASGRQSQPNSQ
ncbi:tetratricopeptide repeat protein [Nodosilinea sp. AN01ver1]|uniref:tetratricopeptide repeat protein n=1 Tax=Nodosilinea sp. AN01ver1 TaxID=3423362 RepID=UPI003D31A8E3